MSFTKAFEKFKKATKNDKAINLLRAVSPEAVDAEFDGVKMRVFFDSHEPLDDVGALASTFGVSVTVDAPSKSFTVKASSIVKASGLKEVDGVTYRLMTPAAAVNALTTLVRSLRALGFEASFVHRALFPQALSSRVKNTIKFTLLQIELIQRHGSDLRTVGLSAPVLGSALPGAVNVLMHGVEPQEAAHTVDDYPANVTFSAEGYSVQPVFMRVPAGHLMYNSALAMSSDYTALHQARLPKDSVYGNLAQQVVLLRQLTIFVDRASELLESSYGFATDTRAPVLYADRFNEDHLTLRVELTTTEPVDRPSWEELSAEVYDAFTDIVVPKVPGIARVKTITASTPKGTTFSTSFKVPTALLLKLR